MIHRFSHHIMYFKGRIGPRIDMHRRIRAVGKSSHVLRTKVLSPDHNITSRAIGEDRTTRSGCLPPNWDLVPIFLWLQMETFFRLDYRTAVWRIARVHAPLLFLLKTRTCIFSCSLIGMIFSQFLFAFASWSRRELHDATHTYVDHAM